ncbi:glycosyltransferase [Microcoleus sp. FACHB-1515]|uniref:glycosyltransferase n=1 Tax=Cyanophyceae TaxID=3028117 RepID=UPI001684E659|nr:glycosyltransferase [Microcoleus sp. FACHB-1515]MBD2089000.1 glycosyltransferase [Microcoleus sp. FACHB-1515]
MSFFLRPEPTVSVVIPAYNCDRYLAEAIDSVLCQTEQDYELIVIDDGSTDRTQQILQTYRNQSLNIDLRTVCQPNQGVAIARNHGIELARGKWIAFLDADDVFLPDKLAAQVAIAQANSDVGIVHSGWQRINATGEILMQVEPWQQIPTLDLESWLRWKPVLPSAMLFRRDWLDRAGGFDPRFPPAEDTELVLRLARMGCRSIWLPQVTVRYRQHENSAMHQGLPQARSLAAVIDYFFTQPDLPPAIRHLESQIRYSTLIWTAWYLHHTGHAAEMSRTLQKAWKLSPYPPIETIVHWADCFASYAQNWGIDFDAQALAVSAEWQTLSKWVLNQNNSSPKSIALD